MTTADGALRGTAAELLNSINSFKFIVCLELLTPVMKAVNNVSEALQSPSSDILMQSQLAALSAELARLRSDDIRCSFRFSRSTVTHNNLRIL